MNSGFSLPSLSKLESTKSFDGKTNLLDFVEKSLGDNVDCVASMGSALVVVVVVLFVYCTSYCCI